MVSGGSCPDGIPTTGGDEVGLFESEQRPHLAGRMHPGATTVPDLTDFTIFTSFTEW